MSQTNVRNVEVPPKFRHFIVTDDFDRYGLRPGEPTSSPHYLQVELTDLCNLTCAGCVRSEHESVGSVLDLATFIDLLDQLPDLEHVSFVGAGEAIIVRNFAEYVRSCSERGLFSSTNTNGLLVRRRLEVALEAGLGLLAISVDGADDATLSVMRSGLKISQLSASIEAAATMTQRAGARLSAAVTLSSTNIASFADIVQYVADRGIHEITVESLHHWGDDKRLNAQSLFALTPTTVIAHLEDGLSVALERDVNLSIFDYTRLLTPSIADAVCPWPWDAFYLTRDGDVTPCCVNMEASPANRLGSISEAPIQEIWEGTEFTRLRNSFLGEPTWSSCEECVYRMEFGRVE